MPRGVRSNALFGLGAGAKGKTMTAVERATKLRKLLEESLALNMEHRESIPAAVRKAYDPESFAAEFCTVRLDVGRAIGKSRLIADAAGEDAIVIVYSMGVKSSFPATKAIVLTTDEAVHWTPPAGRAFKTVFVDEPSYSMCRSEVDRNAIYARLCGEVGERTFVLLGM